MTINLTVPNPTGSLELKPRITVIGVGELASTILDKQVRLGRPANITGLADSANGPAFSVCAGLIDFALSDRSEAAVPSTRSLEVPVGRFGRLGQWLRENI